MLLIQSLNRVIATTVLSVCCGLAVCACRSLPHQPVAQKQTEEATSHLTLVQKFTRDDLSSVTSVDYSPDGRFLYASTWRVGTHVVASVDKETGKLTHVQTIEGEARLNGAAGLRLSRDGSLAAAGAFRAETVTLYTRDAKSGELTYRDHKTNGVDGVTGLDWCVDAMFATDGKFLYGLADHVGLTAFRVVGKKGDPKLEFVQVNRHESLLGIRGMAVHPGGEYFFATCHDANTLVVLRRDPMAGTTKVHQVLTNGEDDARGLGGSYGAAVSPDGKFVYSVSGQHGGDDAVCVYQFDQDKGRLTQIQVIDDYDIEGWHVPVGFRGGNEIAVSPDGRNVYAVATGSGALAAFDRNPKTGMPKLIVLIGEAAAVKGSAGVAVSPDGRFVAVAAEERQTVSIFRRRPK